MKTEAVFGRQVNLGVIVLHKDSLPSPSSNNIRHSTTSDIVPRTSRQADRNSITTN